MSTILENSRQGLTDHCEHAFYSLSPQCDCLVTFSIKAEAIFSNRAVQRGLSLARFKTRDSQTDVEVNTHRQEENGIQSKAVIVNNHVMLPDRHQSCFFRVLIARLKLQLRFPHRLSRRCELWNHEETIRAFVLHVGFFSRLFS